MTKRPQSLETSETDPIVQDLSRPVDDLVYDWKEPNQGSKRPRDIPPNVWASFGPSERQKELDRRAVLITALPALKSRVKIIEFACSDASSICSVALS